MVEIDMVSLVLNNGVAVGVMIYFLLAIKPAIDKNTEMLGRVLATLDAFSYIKKPPN